MRAITDPTKKKPEATASPQTDPTKKKPEATASPELAPDYRDPPFYDWEKRLDPMATGAITPTDGPLEFLIGLGGPALVKGLLSKAAKLALKRPISLSKGLMPESMKVLKLQNQANRAIRKNMVEDRFLRDRADHILRIAEREYRQGNARALGDATKLIDDMKFYEKMDNIEYGQFIDKIEDFFRRYPGASDISSMNEYGGRLGR